MRGLVFFGIYCFGFRLSCILKRPGDIASRVARNIREVMSTFTVSPTKARTTTLTQTPGRLSKASKDVKA